MQNHTQQSKNADFSSKRTSFDPPPSQTNIVRLKQNAGDWRRPLTRQNTIPQNLLTSSKACPTLNLCSSFRVQYFFLFFQASGSNSNDALHSANGPVATLQQLSGSGCPVSANTHGHTDHNTDVC